MTDQLEGRHGISAPRVRGDAEDAASRGGFRLSPPRQRTPASVADGGGGMALDAAGASASVSRV